MNNIHYKKVILSSYLRHNRPSPINLIRHNYDSWDSSLPSHQIKIILFPHVDMLYTAWFDNNSISRYIISPDTGYIQLVSTYKYDQ
jgi:hypothetical protein